MKLIIFGFGEKKVARIFLFKSGMFFGGDIMDVNVTVKNGLVKIHGIFGLLLVVVVGSVICAPNPHPHPRATKPLEGDEPFVNSSASTAEVLRKVHTFMTLTKPLGGKRKWVKQEEEATMGAANALAYLTDSFGGQIAGQVLALILSSVTGDVRGILGNSLNLFQDDERRDRVQIFLDDISKQFLEFTGLASLTTTKKPSLQTTLYPGQIVLGSTATGQQGQILGIQPASASAVSVPSGSSYGTVGSSYGTVGTSGVGGSYGSSAGSAGGGGYGSAAGSVGGAYAPVSAGGVGTINTNAALLQQQQQQAQKPVIYVLPQLSNGGTAGAGSTGAEATKTSGSKVTSTSSNVGGDDDSEEEERRDRERDRERKMNDNIDNY